MLLDTTRLDVRVYDPDSGVVTNCELTVALDLYSRCILGLILLPTTRTIDVGGLLWEVCEPFNNRGGDLPYAGVPDALIVAEDRFAGFKEPLERKPTSKKIFKALGVVPEALVVDHGKVFISHYIYALCQMLGISIEPAPIRAPHGKGQVERWFDTLDAYLQTLPGYKGQFIDQRGEDSDRSAVLTIRELELLIRAWIRDVYHVSHHEGIVSPQDPKTKWTPLQRFEVGQRTWGKVTLPATTELAFEFMPMFTRHIHPYGVDLEGLRYNAEALDPYRGRVNLDGNGNDHYGFVFRKHPSDASRIYFQDPQDGVIHEIPWRWIDFVDGPFSDEEMRCAVALFGDDEARPKHEMLREFRQRRDQGEFRQAADVRMNLRDQAAASPILAVINASDEIRRRSYEDPEPVPEAVPTYESDDDFPEEFTDASERIMADSDILHLTAAEDL